MKIDNMDEKVLDFDNLNHNYDGAQMHILPFRTIEEPMLPLGAQSSLLTLWQIKIKQNKSDITAFARKQHKPTSLTQATPYHRYLLMN